MVNWLKRQIMRHFRVRLRDADDCGLTARAQIARLAAFCLAAACLTIVLGAMFTFRLKTLAEEMQRSTLLSLASASSAAFDADAIAALKSAVERGGEISTRDVVEKLKDIRRSDSNLKFVYLMARVGNEVVFLADSESEDSKFYSPPGQPYPESSAALLRAFEDGHGFVEGPFQDSWGELVSAHAPILNKHNGSVVALIGLDIDARTWTSHVFHYVCFGVALTLAAIAILLITTIYAWRLIRINVSLACEEIRQRIAAGNGLLASQRKYYAIAQELEAACQQIEADRIELRAANEQLISSEEELRRSEEKHRKLTESLTDIISIVSEDGNIRFESPSASRVLGYASCGRAGTNFFDAVHPEDLAGALAVYRQVLDAPGTVRIISARYQHEDGTWRLLESTAKNLVDDPALQGVVITSRDVTESKQAEDRTRAAKEMLRNVLETIPVSVFWKDKDLRYAGLNERFAATAGASAADEILGMKDDEISWSGGTSPCAGGSQEVLKTGAAQIGVEECIPTTDGASWIRKNIVPIIGREGATIGVLGTIEDISKEKQLEFQLRKSQRLEALGTLAGGIAHDFNNILGAILGYSELALEELPSGMRSSGYLKEVLSAGRRAAELVKQILAFSRKSEQERKPMRLSGVVDETLNLLRGSLPSTIAIVQRIEPDCPPVLADSSQLGQVVMNLCTNAFHAMEQTGGTLTVGLDCVSIFPGSPCRAGLAPGSYVRLVVQDTGHGMNAKTRERIFDPYFTTKPEGKGSGLGLATVYGIVKSHDGMIDVYSQPERGTKMTVYFPAADAVCKESAIEMTPVHAGSNGERILLVDDNEAMLGATRAVLERLGYTVQAFAASKPALLRFSSEPNAYDLVLTDNTMPELTGFDLAQAILTIRPEIPIVLATGLGEQFVADRARSIGIRATISKPAGKDTLAATLRSVLASRAHAEVLMVDATTEERRALSGRQV